MHPAARHGLRTALSTASRHAFSSTTRAEPLPKTVTKAVQWTCVDCRLRIQTRSLHYDKPTDRLDFLKRFSTSPQQRENDEKKPFVPATVTSPSSNTPSTPTSKALPSHAENRRWQLSRDATKFIDNLLARASIAGQQINTYTGTDYSGIESLRQDIITQEQRVRDCHRTVEDAKTTHTDAFSKQAGAQKEIVSLLERKSSWSPTDLERYMTLVRSEHIHDQAVTAAKDSLAAAERELEGARSLLEKLERKQYHEEQIWSDTIRRNSTWVTFGLMGVNIVLLLAQILVFEPHRRKRIVKDVKAALDEKTLAGPVVTTTEKSVDEIVAPTEADVEVVEKAPVEPQTGEQPLDALMVEEKVAGRTALAAGEVLPEEATDVSEPPVSPAIDPDSSIAASAPTSWEAYQEILRDLFSERLIQVKKVDLTNIALQGAASGVAVMGILFLLLRPK